MADLMMWKPSGPLAGIANPAVVASAGVIAQPLDNLGLATVLARKGGREAFAAKVKALYGIELPTRPGRTAAGAVSFVATGPGAWLAVNEAGPGDWAQSLGEVLAGLASVSDQSDGYVAIRLEGPKVADVLAKGVFLDLHPSTFPVGASAGTVIAHMGVILWRREELVFDLLTFRSFAASLWHWLEESAAEHGLAVLPAAM
jgi:methylglutamate dehydrogenase subunit D